MGVVHHASFLAYLEDARTRLLEDAGFPYHLVEAGGHALVVRRVDLRYRAPAHYGESLVVRTRVGRLRHATAEFTYVIQREADGTTLVEASTELACVTLDEGGNRPSPIPEAIRAILVEHQDRVG